MLLEAAAVPSATIGLRSFCVATHERHQLSGHGDEGPYHVTVFVFQDVAVAHVPAAVAGEQDGDRHDFIGVDPDGVL
jgi:hypothetical protein